MKKIIFISFLFLNTFFLINIVEPVFSGSGGSGSGLVLASDSPSSWADGISEDRGWSDLIKIARNVFNIFLAIIGSIAVLMIIWGGIIYITSSGNEQRLEQAKKVITYAIVGIIIATLSFAMISLVGGLINSVG